MGFSRPESGVGCHFLLRGIFPIQGPNPCLLHWQEDSLPLSQLGSPWGIVAINKFPLNKLTTMKKYRRTPPPPLPRWPNFYHECFAEGNWELGCQGWENKRELFSTCLGPMIFNSSSTQSPDCTPRWCYRAPRVQTASPW